MVMKPERLLAQITAWTYRQQGLDHSAPGPLEALHKVVGVYSSHPSGPLSLAARSQSFSASEFTALETGRQIVRIPAMRKSIHIVPRDTAQLIFSATSSTPQTARHIDSRKETVGAGYERWSEQIQAAATQPMSLDDLRQATRSEAPAEVPVDLLVKTMCREGRMLRIGDPGLRANGLRYVSLAAWLGQPLPEVDPEDALAWLAGEYLRAFGPVRVSDFAWWAGVSLTRAKAAFQVHHPVDLGSGLWLPQSLLGDFQAVEPRPAAGQVDLLPKWDAYTMGYPADGRQRFIGRELQQFAYTPVGDGLPVVLVDGRATAIWEARFSGERWVVLVRAPDLLPDPVQERVEARLAEIAALLSAAHFEVTFDVI